MSNTTSPARCPLCDQPVLGICTACLTTLLTGKKSEPEKPKTPTLVKTDVRRFWEQCVKCRGSGKQDCAPALGWYVDYLYQDGSELSGPMTQAEAVERYTTTIENVTLIGPDGYVYTLPKETS